MSISTRIDATAIATPILGDDFLPAADVAKAFDFDYSEEQQTAQANTLLSRQRLKWLRNGYMFTAAPPIAMNLLEVCALDPLLLYPETVGWFENDCQIFSRVDVVSPIGWLAVRTGAYPHSFKMRWDNQKRLLIGEERVPNAAEVAYALIAYYKVRTVYLLPDSYVRTSSIDAEGDRVLVGCFDAEGLDIKECWNRKRRRNIGVLSALK